MLCALGALNYVISDSPPSIYNDISSGKIVLNLILEHRPFERSLKIISYVLTEKSFNIPLCFAEKRLLPVLQFKSKYSCTKREINCVASKKV